jgi:uncharacterized protein YndB with AHSA1/START domain
MTTIEPLRASVTVQRPPDDAFRLFTRDMGAWWPLDRHSLAADEYDGRVTVEALTFEERAGGRIVERMSDGREGTWGTVLVWEPPSRLVLAWKPNTNELPPTELEIRFTSAGAGTLVELEHRGWERLGVAADGARAGYGAGWAGVLTAFAAAADGEEMRDATERVR